MKSLRFAIQCTLGIIFALYLALIFALDTPWVQKRVASRTAEALTEFLGARVSIERIALGLTGSVSLHDVTLEDKSGETLINSQLIYAKVRPLSLLGNHIFLRNVALLDGDIALRRDTATGQTNVQFLIDAFSNPDRPPKRRTFRVNSLVVRRCHLTFDDGPRPAVRRATFDKRHIAASLDNVNLSLRHLSPDSLDIRVRDLAVREDCGLTVSSGRLRLMAGRSNASLTDLDLRMPHSRLACRSLQASYTIPRDSTAWTTLMRTLNVPATQIDATVATADLCGIVPQCAEVDETLVLRAPVSVNGQRIRLSDFSLSTLSDALALNGDVLLDVSHRPALDVKVTDLGLLTKADWVCDNYTALTGKSLPEAIRALGAVGINGNGTYRYSAARAPEMTATNAGNVQCKVTSALGTLEAQAALTADNAVTLQLASAGLDATPLAKDRTMPSDLSFDITASGHLRRTPSAVATIDASRPRTTLALADMTTKASIHTIRYGKTALRDIVLTAATDGKTASAQLTSDDPAATLSLSASTTLATDKPFGALPQEVELAIGVARLIPSRLGLTQHFGPRGTFSFDLNGSATPAELAQLEADVSVTDFALADDGDNVVPFRMNRLDLSVYPTHDAATHVAMRSDFARLDYDGPTDPTSLKQLVMALARKIAGDADAAGRNGKNTADVSTNITANTGERKNAASSTAADVATAAAVATSSTAAATATSTPPQLNFALAISDTEFISRFLKVPIESNSTIQAEGYATGDGQRASFSLLAPHLKFGRATLRDVSVYARSLGGEVSLLAKIASALRDGRRLQAELTTKGRDGRLETDLSWDEDSHAWTGQISTVTQLRMNEGSLHSLSTRFNPTTLCIGDSIWNVSEGTVDYADGKISIDRVGVSHAAQQLAINGAYHTDRQTAEQHDDTITVRLDDVDLAYALAFAHIGVVDFGGHATGNILVRQLPDGSPWARATIRVPDFLFNDTPMGDADITVGWEHARHDITLSGDITQPGGFTRVRGYVDPIDRDLDLRTESRATPLGFLNKYTAGIFADVSGHATGHCRIYGGFRSIEFSGHEVGSARATIPVTGVTYDVTGADVDIQPNAFLIRTAQLTDGATGRGTASGALRHEHLRDMTYDFQLSGTDLRLYDLPREIDMPFYATATGSGNVHIYGSPGKMNADIRVQTAPGSTLTYILDSPDADASQLLTLREGTETDAEVKLPQMVESEFNTDTETPSTTASTHSEPAAKTDISLYLEVDVEDQSSLHLITDDKSGDVITVYGSGPIQARYHNKRGFEMYGTYNISRGTYGLNIPMLAQRRRFEILDGGKVQFSGDPTEADVQVRAQYVVASASLSDLGLGNQLSSSPTRVNCLADIHGQVAALEFDLDFALPNCSEDEQQMVRQLIASDEDRTMQVLYLLGVGRFYAYNLTGFEGAQSQTTMMMNSLLSSTLSSQLNNIIASAVGTSNWSFGTNISTGQMGWSDMEVEGLVSSRLLSGRLLLNGNFGYSERQTATTNFVGDFDVQYLVTPRGTVAVRAYSETNDRYFTKSSLTTQGVGLQLRRDFTRITQLFRRRTKRDAK